ncbi:MAG TPA: hypothetical protein VEL74_20960 [Thermoanaerobaculia bacterium]|nr:hypothetical protein [Thermoanaerobaculia bacterium]
MSDAPPGTGGGEGGLRNCDIVMKGGITSGVVYPSAVCELAKAFRFRNIGGTSAGAIAAAATAAAEYGRREGKGTAFEGLAALPGRLAEKLPDGRSRLLSFFQPSTETKPLFEVFVTAVEGGGKARLIARVVRRVLAGFPVGGWIGALVVGLVPLLALVAAWLAVDSLPLRLGLGLALLWQLVLIVAAAVAGSAAALIGRAARAIPENGYGLCRGYDAAREGAHPPADPPPLTEWLADFLNELAGKPRRDEPLTFGDLESGAPGTSICLRMMTSSVTLGRPFQMPFEKVFYFRESQLRDYFPAWVVKWMVDHPNPNAKTSPMLGGETLCPLPGPADLPVVVAARMSLSFPILISAVPLYAVDWRTPKESGPPEPETCWFSDGGLGSNLPIHFFDAPLPRWPTVAINLAEKDHIQAREKDNVWLAKDNRGDILESWTRFDGLTGFVLSLVNVMQNWRDETLAKMPGFRDRIAHIDLGPGEGGLNLVMGEEALKRLTERGTWAGIKLRRRFTEPPGEEDKLSWENQRWVRYRSFMAAVEEMLGEFKAVYRQQDPGEPSYKDLIELRKPPSYPLKSKKLQKRFLEMTERLMELADRLEAEPTFGEADPPSPSGDLRVVPRL